MSSSILYPPNSHLLSDSVINTTARRPKNFQRTISGTEYQNEMTADECHADQSRWSSRSTQAASSHSRLIHTSEDRSYTYENPATDTNPSMETKRKRIETETQVGSKRLRAATVAENQLTQFVTVHAKPGHNLTSIAELLQLSQHIQRKKSREIQRRYRKKKNDLLGALETTVERLREEILELHERKSDISTALLSKTSIWNVAVEYFRLFRHGLTLGPQLTKDAAYHFEAQLDFVQSSMACDVTSTSGNGPDAITKSWGYSQWFENVDVQVESMEKNAENLLVAFTKTEVTITAQTLRVLFPHLCSVERESDEFKLASKLLNQRVVMHGTTSFHWDAASERVTNVVAQSDFLTPMLQLLGNLDAVTLVFGQALISPDFLWKSEL